MERNTKSQPIEWLLSHEPWIAYRTRIDLLHQTDKDAETARSRREMLSSPLVQALLEELAEWPGVVISSHKSAGQLFHKLTLAADLGLKADDPGVSVIIKRILAHQSDEGPFQLPMNIPKHFGGTGRDEWAWALCDAPLTVYALIKFGLVDEPRVQRAVQHLAGLVRENGWPCAVSKELGKFRGPGRKEDPCPFANLAVLKVLAQIPSLRDSGASRAGAETLLTLWTESQERHPYMFYMGTDFRKLKAPFVWYDILHVLDVLSQFPWLKKDRRLLGMLNIVRDKADEQGRFTPESIWTVWKDYEFGQKKSPSRWLTLLTWRIIERIEN